MMKTSLIKQILLQINIVRLKRARETYAAVYVLKFKSTVAGAASSSSVMSAGRLPPKELFGKVQGRFYILSNSPRITA